MLDTRSVRRHTFALCTTRRIAATPEVLAAAMTGMEGAMFPSLNIPPAGAEPVDPAVRRVACRVLLRVSLQILFDKVSVRVSFSGPPFGTPWSF